MTEIAIGTDRKILEDALDQNWKEIIVDVGSGNKVSTSPGEGTLLILVDPRLNPKDLDWGENEDLGGKIIALPSNINEASDPLEGKVNRVQMIAPDPEYVQSMVEKSMPLVKRGGEIVLAFDRTSNKFQFVNEKIRSISDEAKRFGFMARRSNDDIDELVDGEVNSEFIDEDPKILILRKVR